VAGFAQPAVDNSKRQARVSFLINFHLVWGRAAAL
jgi:hypothetical protein